MLGTRALAALACIGRTPLSLCHTSSFTQELEKRIFEHDTCVEEQKPDELLKVRGLWSWLRGQRPPTRSHAVLLISCCG